MLLISKNKEAASASGYKKVSAVRLKRAELITSNKSLF